MPEYQYQAITESGNKVSGKLYAESLEMANQTLASQGFIPSKVTPRGGTKKSSFSTLNTLLNRVKAPELILFTKQFRTLFKVGVPIVRIMDVLENQNENPQLKEASIKIRHDIREGSSLYRSFSRFPNIFSPLYCSMLRAGEAGGVLPEVLDRVIYIIDHEHKVKKDIQSALTYPIIVSVALIVAFFVLLTFVVPKFVVIFEKGGVELPLPTRICIGLYEFLAAFWPYLLAGFIITLIGLIFYLRTEKGKLTRDKFLLNLPALGPVFQKAAMSRFASIFAMLQASGITALESMDILSGTIGNTAISREFDKLKSQLEEGRGISEPLRSSRYFTPMVIDMIAIGEESGNLDEMLREVSQHYDYEVEYAVNRMSELIGPVLIVGLAGVVGFFALSIFLPLADLSKAAMSQMR